MKYFSIIITIILTISCKNESNKAKMDINDYALVHKDLYSSNHRLLNKINKDLSSKSDSAYLKLSQYIDLVVNVLIANSGGQNPENGNLVNPTDTTTWVKTLKEIDFRRNWKLGLKKLGKGEGKNKNATKLLNSGFERIDMAKQNNWKLNRLCIEFRLLQLEVLGYWICQR